MIIDGKKISDEIREQIKTEVAEIEDRKPVLAVVLIGSDSASQVYVRNKENACRNVGIVSHTFKMDDNASQEDVIKLIEALNEDDNIDGLLVQVPLPKHLDEKYILSKVSAKKDVDGFHKDSISSMYLNEDTFLPCTANGVIELIKSTGETIEGKNVVIIGRSNIVGKPLSLMMLQENATVTVCHSRTKDIAKHTLSADIVVAAVGIKHFVTADMIADNAIVIDVGINRVDGKLYGDVDYENVAKKASYITPVPGGVGPMTITMLLKNTVKAYKMKV